MKAKQIITVLFSFAILFLSAQEKDPCCPTPYKKINEKIWGNLWTFAIQSDFNSNSYLGFDVGRTYGKTPEWLITQTTSFGLGYTQSLNSNAQYIRVFGQYSYSLGSVRMEYLQSINSSEKYLRPGVGINIIKFVDILYNYSIPLTPEPNRMKHGLTLKINLFYPMKNWDKGARGTFG